MKESGATLRREDFGMLGVRYEYAIQSPVQHGSGQEGFGTNKLCERLADAGLLTVDLRGRVGLPSEAEHCRVAFRVRIQGAIFLERHWNLG